VIDFSFSLPPNCTDRLLTRLLQSTCCHYHADACALPTSLTQALLGFLLILSVSFVKLFVNILPIFIDRHFVFWHNCMADTKCWLVLYRNYLSHILKLFKYGKEVNGSQNVTNKDSTPFVLTLTLGTSIPSSSKMVAE
jgi:hypothetical protein